MTSTTGAGLGPGIIQSNTQFVLTEQVGPVGHGGQLLANYMAQCRAPGGCGEGGGQQNRLGRTLMRDGEQEVEEGQQLIEEGDVQDGMQLVDQGARLEMEGAAYEAQGGEGMPGGMDPMGGMMLGGMNAMGGQDPCNPMGGQYGSPFPTGMGGQDPCNPMYGMNSGNGFGDGGMSVDRANNTITVGDYKIAASPNESGQLTVTNTCTNQTFSVWGDPHISTANGGVADFQHNNATIKLPNGAEINITPTGNPTGPNTMSQVVVTYGSQAASFNFANGSVQTQDLPGQGYALDDSLPGGVQMTATPDGNLTLANGTEIGPKTGNIDGDATDGPMGFGTPLGTGMATNGGNFAQLIAMGDQEMLDNVMTNAV